MTKQPGLSSPVPPPLPLSCTLVALGGAFGTAIRFGIASVISTDDGADAIPFGIFTVNLIGAFLMGFLVAVLAKVEAKHAHKWRLFLATGMLGGFTTYSALAVDSATLMMRGNIVLAFLYSFGTVILGVLVCWLGVFIGNKAAQ